MTPSIPGALLDVAFFFSAFWTIPAEITKALGPIVGLGGGAQDGSVCGMSAAANTSVKNSVHSSLEHSGGSDPIALPQIKSASFFGFLDARSWCCLIFLAVAISSAVLCRALWISASASV